MENWYNTNIGNNIHYANKVADGKFCNDRNVENGQSWSSIPSNSFNYATVRLVNAKIPILSCASEDLYTLKTGVIMADEVAFAGGVYHQTNQSYYLYNGQSYWTISPADWWFDYDAWAGEFLVSNDGQLSALSVSDAHDNMRGVRPVINLRSDIIFSSGDGTLNNPYEVI